MKKKQSNLLLSFLLIIVLLFPSCQVNLPDSSGENSTFTAKQTAAREAFEAFLNEEFQNAFEDSLLTLHYTLKNPENYGIEKPQKAFPAITEDYNEQCKKELLATQKALSTIGRSDLTENQQITYETVEKYVEQQLALCDYPQFLHVLGASSGLSSNLPLTLAEYTFYLEEDVKDYLSILTQIPTLFEEAFAWEKKQAEEGYSLSDFEIEDTINQIDRFLNPSKTVSSTEIGDDTLTLENNTRNNLLIETFNTRIDNIENFSEDQKKTYKKNNEHLVKNTVIPAFETLKENLLLLQENAPTGQGLSHYENGADYYEQLIQSMTMSDRSISTLIKTLEKRMETITKRITTVASQSPEAYEIFTTTEVFTDQTPAEMLATLSELIKADYPALSDVTYKVEPIPDALKNNTTAAYYMVPPFDSAEENRIYYGDSALSSASLFMTLAHEGYPGHLYHQNYLLENDLHPIFYVLDITGYKEAWAYYAANDAADYCDFGIYDEEYHEELTELYRCNDEFSYCLCSLVDLYVNYEGYDEEMVGNVLTKYGLDSTSAKAFFEYAVEEPGAYLQYYVGYLELIAIRQNSEKILGNNFNEKQFHTELLEIGPCYFSQIKKIIKNSEF